MLAAQCLVMRGSLSVSMGREQSSFMMTTGKTDAKQSAAILAEMVTAPALGSFEKEKAALIRTTSVR